MRELFRAGGEKLFLGIRLAGGGFIRAVRAVRASTGCDSGRGVRLRRGSLGEDPRGAHPVRGRPRRDSGRLRRPPRLGRPASAGGEPRAERPGAAPDIERRSSPSGSMRTTSSQSTSWQGHYPVDGIKEIGSWLRPVWKIEAGRIGGRSYSLDAIEHEILRPLGDPRIHGAVVCASTSCPPLRREPYRGSGSTFSSTTTWVAGWQTRARVSGSTTSRSESISARSSGGSLRTSRAPAARSDSLPSTFRRPSGSGSRDTAPRWRSPGSTTTGA